MICSRFSNNRDKAAAAASLGDKGLDQHHTVRQMQFVAAADIAASLHHGSRES